MIAKNRNNNPLISCGCGCGAKLNELDNRGRAREFLIGHWSKANRKLSTAHLKIFNVQNKGKTGLFWKKIIAQRTSRYRAHVIAIKQTCDINNKHCKGRLELAHLDGNEFNNDPKNLATLCSSHHKLLDNRKVAINILPLIDSKYYIDRSGKKRYKHD